MPSADLLIIHHRDHPPPSSFDPPVPDPHSTRRQELASRIMKKWLRRKKHPQPPSTTTHRDHHHHAPLKLAPSFKNFRRRKSSSSSSHPLAITPIPEEVAYEEEEDQNEQDLRDDAGVIAARNHQKQVANSKNVEAPPKRPLFFRRSRSSSASGAELDNWSSTSSLTAPDTCGTELGFSEHGTDGGVEQHPHYYEEHQDHLNSTRGKQTHQPMLEVVVSREDMKDWSTRSNRFLSSDWAPEQTSSPLPEAIHLWFDATGDLLQSPQMAVFVGSTGRLVLSAGQLSVRVACLPVTVPMHVVGAAIDLLLSTSRQVVGTAGTLLDQIFMVLAPSVMMPRHLAVLEIHSDQNKQDTEYVMPSKSLGTTPVVSATTVSEASNFELPPPSSLPHGVNPVVGLVQGVMGWPGWALSVAGKVRDDVGHLAVHLISPVLGGKGDHPSSSPHDRLPEKRLSSGNGSSPMEQDNFLDRLRLDYLLVDETGSSVDPALHFSSSSQAGEMSNGDEVASLTQDQPGPGGMDRSQSSKALLRVDDLDFFDVQGTGLQIYFVDLSPPFAEEALLKQALTRLVHRGLAFMANHPTVRLAKNYPTCKDTEVVWKPEGGTQHVLRRMAKMSTLERLKTLQHETVMWSGKFQNQEGYGRGPPIFLARGIVHRSPLEFLRLLWDNARTTEYNNFCLGRTTLIALDDKILTGASVGTKVIKSETRVPFTNLSVEVSCMMHVRPLESPDEGFVILSRSLDSGVAGVHVGSRDHVERGRKNEILWGINILRRVPNHLHWTDLTSLSQVGSALVPHFLAHKIGLMGVEDFFRNVRKGSPDST